ncbi:SGNH/GDSL hydrolase family protein [Gephyromycinifex aptenodytis]|uniref:SGNH/GDSL hydrolase family protein n=1 Tax=Gephyromycinifex aptenodytis TaxID=2716227 RepID=UPI001445F4D7|nr:SGNH/GDSL hydrolase family protein [Gephyromycinifex aptenodytis]
MSRARRARRIAASAAYGGGIGFAGLGAAGLVSYGLLKFEARLARAAIGKPFDASPDDTNLYGAGFGEPIQLVVLGDSLAAGLGADNRFQTLGGVLATGVAALAGRPVQLTNVAEVGAESPWLDAQVVRALAAVPTPDVALISVGGNDVTHGLDRAVSVRHLQEAVRALRASGAEVVVGTCPDLGTIDPLPQPLRTLAKHWSRDLAAAQTVAVVEAGGRTVSLGDLLRPDFISAPDHMFSVDGFHPSPAGYARASAALLPTVCAALGLWASELDRKPDRLRGERIGPVAVTAERAVREPGTEVSGTAVHGRGHGPRGRWAVLLRRRRPDGPPESDRDDDGEEEYADAAASPATTAPIRDVPDQDGQHHAARKPQT